MVPSVASVAALGAQIVETLNGSWSNFKQFANAQVGRLTDESLPLKRRNCRSIDTTTYYLITG